MILAASLVAALALALLVQGVALGYPAPTEPTDVLSAKEQAILRACAEAMFPGRKGQTHSATEAGVLGYFATTVREAPPRVALLIRLLLRFVEHGPWLFGARRLTRQSPADRVRTLASWERSSIYFLRLSFTSLRTLIAMGYLAHPRAAADLGIRYGQAEVSS